MYRAMYPGCVVVVDGGPDEHCGLTGEMTYQSKQYGARGVVVDGIRDVPGYSHSGLAGLCAGYFGH